MYVILQATAGPYNGKKFKVLLKGPKYECYLGRTITGDGFKLDKDPEVSGHHLTFKWSLDHDCLQVQDEKSFNGTALNLNIMKPKVFYSVRSGSTLHVGQSTFTILIKEKDEENSSKDKVNKNVCTCPICFRDLSGMTEMGRTQHVNNCLPERQEVSKSVIDKAQQYTQSQSYQSMSLKELTSLKQRMEDIRAKLEIEYQKVQKVFYQKRAEEVLNLSASKEATRKRESYSKTIDMIYSVPEEEVDREKRREISKTQAQLTGCMLEEQQEYKEYEERQTRQDRLERQDSPTNPEQSFSDDALSSSEDSLLAQNVPSTPTKRVHSLPTSPSKGITHINPRRSSIMVSPTKKLPVLNQHLSIQDRNQHLQFYLKQIPPSLRSIPVSELQKQIISILSCSLSEVKEMKESMEEQAKKTEAITRETLIYLVQIANDMINEFETTKKEDILKSPEKTVVLHTPRKSLYQHVTSPKKTVVTRMDVSEDTIKKIHQAIEKDKNLSYQINSKQVIYFDRIATCIRKSLPTISTEVIQYVLDKENVKYELNVP